LIIIAIFICSFPFVLYCQVVVKFIGDCLIEYAGQHLAEQTGDDEYQNDNKNGRRYINEKATGGYERDAEAVYAHLVEAVHVFPDKAIVPDNGEEHFAQFMNDQNGEYARQKEHNEQRIKIISEIGIVFSIISDAEWESSGNENTGKIHQIQ